MYHHVLMCSYLCCYYKNTKLNAHPITEHKFLVEHKLSWGDCNYFLRCYLLPHYNQLAIVRSASIGGNVWREENWIYLHFRSDHNELRSVLGCLLVSENWREESTSDSQTRAGHLPFFSSTFCLHFHQVASLSCNQVSIKLLNIN